MKKIFYKIYKKFRQFFNSKSLNLFHSGTLAMKKFNSFGSKKFLTGQDSLLLDRKQRLIKEEINIEARTILKDSIENPEIMLNFIKSKGTYVVKSKYMTPVLFIFGKTIGFIPPIKGLKAYLFTIALNFISRTKIKPDFETPPMFALKNTPVNIYFISHQFHLWLSFINRLPGFEEKTSENFTNLWNSGNVSRLSAEEIISLKDFISREFEAIKFVQEMSRELVGQKESLKKLKEGKSVNL